LKNTIDTSNKNDRAVAAIVAVAFYVISTKNSEYTGHEAKPDDGFIGQHTATHSNTLQHTATHTGYEAKPNDGFMGQHTQHTATHCNTLQHAQDTKLNRMMSSGGNALQHTTTHCNTHRTRN